MLRPFLVWFASLPFAAGLLAGCAAGPPDATRVAVLEISVEALPLDRPWDGKLTADPPDVYVDIRQANPSSPFNYNGALIRTSVIDGVTASQLPLHLTPHPEATVVPVGAPVKLVVADRDSHSELNADDTIFSTSDFRFASRRGEAQPGDTTDVRFGDSQTRVSVRVRWEAPPE